MLRRTLFFAALAFASLSCALGQQKSGISMSQLNLNAGEDQPAFINFGQESRVYTVGAKKTGFFIEYQDEDLLSIDPKGNVVIRTDSVVMNALSTSSLIIEGVPQFSVYALESFDSMSPFEAGWFGGERNTPTMNCSVFTILTGALYSKKLPDMDSFSKHYEDLPDHDQIRLQATVHFVDDWQGESAYMKIDDHYVWTTSHDQRSARGSINVCGNGKFSESKFTVPIDVTLKHSGKKLKVSFGSTLDNTAIAAFGMSSLTVMLRSKAPAPQV